MCVCVRARALVCVCVWVRVCVCVCVFACNIGGTETLLMHSQLSWDSHVARMIDDRILKIFDSGKMNIGRLWFMHKDKVNVPHTNFERIAPDRNNRRYLCQSCIRNF